MVRFTVYEDKKSLRAGPGRIDSWCRPPQTLSTHYFGDDPGVKTYRNSYFSSAKDAHSHLLSYALSGL